MEYDPYERKPSHILAANHADWFAQAITPLLREFMIHGYKHGYKDGFEDGKKEANNGKEEG